MHRRIGKVAPSFRARRVTGCLLLWSACLSFASESESLVVRTTPGKSGGDLVIALRAEPKTLLPLSAVDASSKELLSLLHSDLIHIHRPSQQTAAALAREWQLSADGLRYTLRLRRGLRFSDGHPLTAEDVAFTFRVLLDEQVKAPGRDLLRIRGRFPAVRTLGRETVEVTLPAPYAPAERLFDSIAILPRHRLEAAYREGKLLQSWALNTSPEEIVGAGPFRLCEYVPGRRIVVERNPFYWKRDSNGTALPYLDKVTILFLPDQEAELFRFRAGETHLHGRLTARGFAALESLPASRRPALADLGPGLEQHLLFFNQNDAAAKGLAALEAKQAWLQDVRFRRAVSLAIDRTGIARLVFQGKASPLAHHVSPGNRLWHTAIEGLPKYAPDEATRALQAMGLRWKADRWFDATGAPVAFSIAVNAANGEQRQMAAMIQEDLREIGIDVSVVPLEFRSLIDRVMQTLDYEAAILGLRDGDVDPVPQMPMLLSTGRMHFWRPNQQNAATPWEAEIDRLMELQAAERDLRRRAAHYAEVQRIVAAELPFLALVSPHVLTGAHPDLGNVQPSVLAPYLLDGLDAVFWRRSGRTR
ncbi:MAG: ABC transporter substrate-binding protein [Bryobacterales bacterium]|nr:ABC transporter substrate-binding protein [Bryobacterales bacterium]